MGGIACRTVLVVVGMVLLIPVDAKGQRWEVPRPLHLEPSKRNLGLAAGEFLLLPRLGVGYGFDSNVFYEFDDEYESPNGAQFILVEPELKVRNRNERNMSLNFRANTSFIRYVTDDKTVSRHDNVGADIGANVLFLADGPVSLALRERFRRALERRNFETARNFNRHFNEIGGGVVFKPGGGALQVRGDYAFVTDMFTDTDNNWGDLYVHDIEVKSAWKFFPFTAAMLEASWQVRDYLDNRRDPTTGEPTYGFYGELTDNSPLRVKAGLHGFITKKLAITALVGYGNSFHVKRKDPPETSPRFKTPNANKSFEGVVGEARLGLHFSPVSVVQAGYQYDFRDSLFSNYVAFHRVYGNIEQRIADRVDLMLDFSYYYMDYAQLPHMYIDRKYPDFSITGLSGFDRVDIIMLGRLRAAFDITRFLAFEASYSLEWVNPRADATKTHRGGAFYTEVHIPKHGNSPAVDVKDTYAYQRHLVLGTFVLRY